jgi:uncharacterized RDD family membrane protein YckC
MAGASVIALVWTILLVQGDKEADPLDYILQMPLGLPWILIPIGPLNAIPRALWYAACGFLNAVLLYCALERGRKRRTPSA